jgi:uncharacterized membrane protein
MPSRVRENPVATLLAVVSAILILVGRLNREAWWGDWLFVGGIILLVLGGVLWFIARR